MSVPEFMEWRRVFLDTTLLINLFNSQRPDCKDPVSLFVNKLIKSLAERKSTSSHPDATVSFFVSSISICEILEKDDQKSMS